MEIQRYEQDARMSDIVVYGDMIYLAGQVCTERDGVRAQTEDTLAIIERLLQLAGSDKSKILSVMIYLSDMRNLPAFNAVWDAWVVPGCTPARACVGVQMARPECLVELCVTAAR